MNGKLFLVLIKSNVEKKEFCVIYEFLETKKNEKLTKERTTTLKSKNKILIIINIII